MFYEAEGFDGELDLLLGLDFIQKFGITVNEGETNPLKDFLTWYGWSPNVFNIKKMTRDNFSRDATRVSSVRTTLSTVTSVTVPARSNLVVSVEPKPVPLVKMQLLRESCLVEKTPSMLVVLSPNTDNPTQHGDKVNGVLSRPNLVFPSTLCTVDDVNYVNISPDGNLRAFNHDTQTWEVVKYNLSLTNPHDHDIDIVPTDKVGSITYRTNISVPVVLDAPEDWIRSQLDRQDHPLTLSESVMPEVTAQPLSQYQDASTSPFGRIDDKRSRCKQTYLALERNRSDLFAYLAVTAWRQKVGQRVEEGGVRQKLKEYQHLRYQLGCLSEETLRVIFELDGMTGKGVSREDRRFRILDSQELLGLIDDSLSCLRRRQHLCSVLHNYRHEPRPRPHPSVASFALSWLPFNYFRSAEPADTCQELVTPTSWISLLLTFTFWSLSAGVLANTTTVPMLPGMVLVVLVQLVLGRLCNVRLRTRLSPKKGVKFRPSSCLKWLLVAFCLFVCIAPTASPMDQAQVRMATSVQVDSVNVEPVESLPPEWDTFLDRYGLRYHWTEEQQEYLSKLNWYQKIADLGEGVRPHHATRAVTCCGCTKKLVTPLTTPGRHYQRTRIKPSKVQ
jgi:hypothetical protein